MADLASNTKDPEALRQEALAAGFSPAQAAAIVADSLGGYTGTRYGTPPASMKQASANVVQAAETATDANAAFRDMIGIMTGQITKAQTKSAEAITAEATALAAREEATTAAKLQQLEQQMQLATMVGLNPAAEQNMLQKNLDAWNAANARIEAVEPVRAALNAINPFANPIAWLAAQAQLRPVEAEFESASLERARVSKDLAERQQILSSQRAFIPAETVDTLRAKTKAEAGVVAAQAAMKHADLVKANATLTMQTGQEIIRAYGADINNSLAALQALNIQAGYEKDQEVKGEQELDLERARRTSTLVGGPPIDSYKALQAMNPQVRQALITANPDTMSYGDMVNLIDLMGSGRGLALKSEAAYKMYYDTKAAILPALNKALLNNPGKKSPEELTRELVNEQVKNWSDEVKSGQYVLTNKYNPYRMNPIEYSHAPGMESNPIAKFVLSQPPQVELGEKEILTYIGSMTRAKNPDGSYTYTPKEVVDATEQFFAQGGDHQFQSRHMGASGFGQIKSGETGAVMYPISHNIFGFLERFKADTPSMSAPVDFRNRSAIENFITLTALNYVPPKELGDRIWRR